MGAEQYVIIVSDIDDLIVDVLKVCSKNPVAFIGCIQSGRSRSHHPAQRSRLAVSHRMATASVIVAS